MQLSSDVRVLAEAAQLVSGKVRFPKPVFAHWQETHAATKGDDAATLGRELVALAIRFRREGGPAAAEAIAQLYVLAAGLLGRVAATKAFRAAGWGPSRGAPAARSTAKTKGGRAKT